MDGSGEGVNAPVGEVTATTVEAPLDAAAPATHGKIAGFWIRVGADLLDAVFLWVVGWLLALPLRDAFLQLGERGVFIGLAISLLYTGLLQSRFGGGRTLGKRILGLTVVRPDGTLMSLDRSLVRYALMGLLVYQGAVAATLALVVPFLSLSMAETLLSAVALALFFGCVLVVPFHPLKRGLHDLLAGTIVVRGGLPDPVYIATRMNPRRDRRIVWGAVSLAAVAVLVATVVSQRMSREPAVASMLSFTNQMEKDGLTQAGVTATVSSLNFGTPSMTVIASGFVRQPAGGGEPDLAALHASLMKSLRDRIATLPRERSVDSVGTALATGFNLGIYKSIQTEVIVESMQTGEVIRRMSNHSW